MPTTPTDRAAVIKAADDLHLTAETVHRAMQHARSSPPDDLCSDFVRRAARLTEAAREVVRWSAEKSRDG